MDDFNSTYNNDCQPVAPLPISAKPPVNTENPPAGDYEVNEQTPVAVSLHNANSVSPVSSYTYSAPTASNGMPDVSAMFTAPAKEQNEPENTNAYGMPQMPGTPVPDYSYDMYGDGYEPTIEEISKKNSRAGWSLALGVLGLLCPVVSGISLSINSMMMSQRLISYSEVFIAPAIIGVIGLVLGILAIVLHSKTSIGIKRNGKATAGLVTGIIAVVLGVATAISWITCAYGAYYYTENPEKFSGSFTLPYDDSDGYDDFDEFDEFFDYYYGNGNDGNGDDSQGYGYDYEDFFGEDFFDEFFKNGNNNYDFAENNDNV